MGKLTRSLPFLHRTDPCRLLLESSDSLLELIHTSAGVNKLLLTGEERMALGANFNFDLAALGGLGLYGFAACASDDALFVLRMDSLFHCSIPHFIILMFFDIISPLGDIRTYYSTIKEELQGFFEKKFAFLYKM